VTGYDIANKLWLITKEPNREILGNKLATYKAVKALITATSLTEFIVITNSAEIYNLANLHATWDAATRSLMPVTQQSTVSISTQQT
jgi:hypothetical protein